MSEIGLVLVEADGIAVLHLIENDAGGYTQVKLLFMIIVQPQVFSNIDIVREVFDTIE